MFIKIKQAIEQWLRGLIAYEVSKLDHDLSNERDSFASTIKEYGAQVNAAVDRLNELSYFRENSELRAIINEMRDKVTHAGDLLKKLHPGKF